MASVSFVEEGMDRVQAAIRNVGDELEGIQKRVEKRRKRFEKEAQKRVKRLRSEIRSSSLAKRAGSLQKDATKQIETGVESFLSSLQIASSADIKKLDRKLSQLSRKLNALEKGRGSA